MPKEKKSKKKSDDKILQQYISTPDDKPKPGSRLAAILAAPMKKVTKKKELKFTKKEKPSKRFKIEPKTHLANERTMLQWMRMALTLFAMGGIIFNLGTVSSATFSGMVFMCISVFIICYALGMFYFRMHQILKRKSCIHDAIGPAVIAVILICAVCLNLYLSYTFFHPSKTQQSANPFAVAITTRK